MQKYLHGRFSVHSVTDGDVKPVHLEGRVPAGFAKRRELSLPPEKGVMLYEMSLKLQSESDKGQARRVWTLVGTGTYQLQYEDVCGGNNPQKLSTGNLELEVKEPEKVL